MLLHQKTSAMLGMAAIAGDITGAEQFVRDIDQMADIKDSEEDRTRNQDLKNCLINLKRLVK